MKLESAIIITLAALQGDLPNAGEYDIKHARGVVRAAAEDVIAIRNRIREGETLTHFKEEMAARLPKFLARLAELEREDNEPSRE